MAVTAIKPLKLNFPIFFYIPQIGQLEQCNPLSYYILPTAAKQSKIFK